MPPSAAKREVVFPLERVDNSENKCTEAQQGEEQLRKVKLLHLLAFKSDNTEEKLEISERGEKSQNR